MSKFTRRENWIKSFFPLSELYLIQKCEDIAIYASKDKPNRYTNSKSPMYYVWKGDDWIHCSPDRNAALNCFDKIVYDMKTGKGEL